MSLHGDSPILFAPAPPPPPERPVRGNSDAFSKVVPLALLTYVVVLVLLWTRISSPRSYVVGELLGTTLLATFALGFGARLIRPRVAWWVYVLVVPVVVAAAMVLSQARDSDGEETAAPVSQAGLTTAALVVPPSTGDWTLVDDRRTRAELEGIKAGMSSMGPGIDVVAGLYRHPTATGSGVVYVGLNGVVGDGSATHAVQSFLDGAGVRDVDPFDPGAVGGALGCGTRIGAGQSLISCVWVSGERAAFLTWDRPTVDLAGAAALTRDFRALALGAD